MTTPPVDEVLRGLRGKLDAKSSSDESWKRDHEQAMFWLDVEEDVAWWLWMYEKIVDLDERWRRDTFAKPDEYSPSDHLGIHKLFTNWFAAVLRFEGGRVAALERDGCVVERVDELRTALREVNWSIQSASTAPVMPGAISELADQAIDEHRADDTQPL